MPRIRPEIASIVRYRPGRPIEEVTRELGISDIIKLASNENPLPPFPEVVEAITQAGSGVNRYPDSGCFELARATSTATGITVDSLWFGAGSSELLSGVSRAVGGPETSFVYADPSFAMYRINAALGAAEAIEVPLDHGHRHDLDAMSEAIRPDTTLVFLCNPNNPTGTYRSAADVAGFLDGVPEQTLVVVDEAYAEYVVADDYSSAIPLALERANVVVARTFSKIYGLAGLRVGYMVGRPDTLESLRSAQIPFSVNAIAQAAAIASLDHPDRLAERAKLNREGVDYLERELQARDIDFAPSQTNFIWVHVGPGARSLSERLMRQGVIVRPLADEWTRVSVGTDRENRRFIDALDVVLSGG